MAKDCKFEPAGKSGCLIEQRTTLQASNGSKHVVSGLQTNMQWRYNIV